MPDASSDNKAQKPFLGIIFDCCRTYGRLYPNHDLTAFIGRCPRCGRHVSIPVGDDGTDARFMRG